MKLQNKIAVITGGAQGIGAAIATRFAREGAKVVIADINEEKSKVLASQLDGSMYVSCDVSNPEQVGNLFNKVIEAFAGSTFSSTTPPSCIIPIRIKTSLNSPQKHGSAHWTST